MSALPRIDLARYRIEKASRQLLIATQSLKNGFVEEVVAKSYYCILTSMRALLAMKGLDARTHEGVINLFHKHFVREKTFPDTFNKIIIDLKDLREDADYGDFTEISENAAKQALKDAEEFFVVAKKALDQLISDSN